jgi:hypothetical protein
MKSLLKNKSSYHLLLPLLAACWPAWVRVASLPAARANWREQSKQHLDAQKLFLQILELDSGRLKVQDPAEARQFDYATEVQKTANATGISAANYRLNVRQSVKIAEQEVQSADLTLENVDITRFALFAASMEANWPNLQCTQINLTKVEGGPDLWRANLQFRYYK